MVSNLHREERLQHASRREGGLDVFSPDFRRYSPGTIFAKIAMSCNNTIIIIYTFMCHGYTIAHQYLDLHTGQIIKFLAVKYRPIILHLSIFPAKV